MALISAERPVLAGGRQYHLRTLPGDLAPDCLLVGSPERAEMVAVLLLKDARLVGNHRGLKSYTGTFMGLPISVVTTGMGGASIGIVLPEAKRSGARIFIKVGSCGALRSEIRPGVSIISTGAVRLDGASDSWAPDGFPAVADFRLVHALVNSARRLSLPSFFGLGATTSCFNEGQGRPDDTGYLPERLRIQHEELVRREVMYYSMEDAALFTWCATHGQHPAAAINAVFANRISGEMEPKGEMEAATIALHALQHNRYIGAISF